MLDSLGHDALIGGDHEYDRRNTAGPGEHGADEQAMPGDVDEADADRRFVRRLHHEGSEAEVDGDATALLFREPVSVDACERANQRRFAVIDVTGGPDDDGFG